VEGGDAVADEATHERLVHIELLLMQLQRDVEQLSKALLDQQGEVVDLKRAVDRLVSSVQEDVAEPRTLEEDRPPHY
jgi:uncharacterized coiled-coil protein SlyX